MALVETKILNSQQMSSFAYGFLCGILAVIVSVIGFVALRFVGKKKQRNVVVVSSSSSRLVLFAEFALRCRALIDVATLWRRRRLRCAATVVEGDVKELHEYRE